MVKFLEKKSMLENFRANVLKNAARAAFSSPRSSFSSGFITIIRHIYHLYTDRPKARLANIVIIFFPPVNWLTNGFVYSTLSLNWFTCRLQTIVKALTSERPSKAWFSYAANLPGRWPPARPGTTLRHL